MTSNLKVLMSAVAGAAIAIALFVSVPANSDSARPRQRTLRSGRLA